MLFLIAVVVFFVVPLFLVAVTVVEFRALVEFKLVAWEEVFVDPVRPVVLEFKVFDELVDLTLDTIELNVEFLVVEFKVELLDVTFVFPVVFPVPFVVVPDTID